MNRKEFIQIVLGSATVAATASSCKKKNLIKGTIIGASSNIGHLLRTANNNAVAETIKSKVVIIGGGISGLSAARHLSSNDLTDFILLDL
ncbi:hypothetical protein [Ferruginibacter sp.]